MMAFCNKQFFFFELVMLLIVFSVCEEKEITEKKTRNEVSNATILVFSTTAKPIEVINLDGWTLEQSMQEICGNINLPPENCTCDVLHNEFGLVGFCDAFAQPVTKYEEVCLKSTIKLVETISVAVISALGIVGNILVLTVRVPNWKLSFHHQIISGLAMADLAFSCIFLIISIPMIWLCRWQFGYALCSFLKTTLTLSSNLDLGFILIISIERYIGIVHPFGLTSCKVYAMICLNVIVGFLTALPFFFIYKIDSNGACREDWSMLPPESSLVYGWISHIFFFLIPMCVTGILYFQSLRALKSTLFRQEMLEKLDEASRKKLLNENKRILRVISTILIAFFFLIGPNHIAWFLFDNFTIPQDINDCLFAISSIAYALHTTINPIIYSIIDRKFRRNVYYLLRHGKGRKSYSTIVTALQSPVHQISNNTGDQNNGTRNGEYVC